MSVLDPPRRAAVGLLDLLGEVAAAAGIVTAYAVAWARGPEPHSRLQLVPPLNPNSSDRARATGTERSVRTR